MSDIDHTESNDKNKYEKIIANINIDKDKEDAYTKTLLNAYNNIDQVTKYEDIECNPHKKLTTAAQYSENLNLYDDIYRYILNLYRKDFIDFKMDNAHNDFFNKSTINNDDVDTELVKKLAKTDITTGKLDLYSSEQGNKKKEKTRMLAKMNEDIEKISNNYNTNYEIGQSGENWSSTIISRVTIDNIEKELIGVQQNLSTMKLNMEKDIHILQSCILKTTEDIDKVQILNNKLKQKINSIRNEAAGGEGKLYDAQLIYNQNYLGNCIILIIVCVVLYKSITHYIVNQEDINNTVKDSVSKLSDMVVNSASQVVNNNEKIDKDV